VASRTLTLSLEGDVPLDLFVEAMKRWQTLINDLSAEIAHDAKIEWVIEYLEAGSATATVRGEAATYEPVERVARGYEVVGRSLENNQPIPYSPKIAGDSYELTTILNGKITAMRLGTPEESATIVSPSLTTYEMRTVTPTLISYGAVEGRIQTLTDRAELRFTLYDAVFDQAVRCYLQDNQREMMRDAWGHRAIVEGRVTRDFLTGRPKEIRRIVRMDILDDVEPGSYRAARGVSPIGPDGLSPEDAVRRVRDAW
jgi:hypothetical protein